MALTGNLQNVAFGKWAEQSSVLPGSPEEQAGYAAITALDGSPGSFSHTNHEVGPWWQIDLGSPHRVVRCEFYNRAGLESRLTKLKILASVDGQIFEIIYIKNDAIPIGATDRDKLVVEFDRMVLCRYLRLMVIGFGCVHLTDCKVFGTEAKGDDVSDSITERSSRFDKFKNGRDGSITNIDGFNVFLDTEKYTDIINDLIRKGEYEYRERALVASLLRPDDVVLEGGTAIGVVTMNAAAMTQPGRVTTYDGNPEMTAAAALNCQFNNLSVNCVNGLLRNRRNWDGAVPSAKFYVSQNFFSSRMFASETDSDIVKVVDVPFFCLEDELERTGATVLVCDIEGGEVDLLMGADLSGLRLIILETHWWVVGRTALSDLVKYLLAQGFFIDLERTKDSILVVTRDLP